MSLFCGETVMKYLVFTMILSGLLAGSAPLTAEETPVSVYRAALKDFMAALKGELQQAMKAGGPVKAIHVCHTQAEALTRQYSEKYGWQLKRTSLKTRNPENAPTPHEQEVLESWQTTFVPGKTDPNSLEELDTIEFNGETKLLYMKGIGVAEVCTLCHGETVASDVEAALVKLYPEDQARGYKAGDLRGAFAIMADEPEIE
jgi:hypothetical protein